MSRRLPIGFRWKADEPHGVANLTAFVPQDDSAYLASAFIGFLGRRAAAGNKPFLAQVSFHK